MPRILIVEDEASLALALEDDLRREGYAVRVVADGETAAREGASERWDLILLDVMLPRKDGFEVCRDLRRAGIRTPILMLTAKAHEAEKVMGLELGADDYVTKPYSARELRRAGQPVELTPLEYKLLAAFVRRPGRVLTRQQLLDEVWGSETFVTERVVDNQVTNLRKKIEPDPDRPRYIVNLRGLGYRFDG
jgi:DNA-binding response OmpR family regulator